MAKKPTPKAAQVDMSVLTPEEIQAIEAEANQEIQAEAKDAAKAVLKEQAKAKARQKTGVDEELVEVTVDLAPYAGEIRLDNVVYMQGVTYTVRASVAQVMREAMQRTWGHQSEIDGKSQNFYQRTRNTRFSMATGSVANGPLRA